MFCRPPSSPLPRPNPKFRKLLAAAERVFSVSFIHTESKSGVLKKVHRLYPFQCLANFQQRFSSYYRSALQNSKFGHSG